MRSSGYAFEVRMRIVTFDFHNTLVQCDRWFELEVRSLPWKVITGLGMPEDERPSRNQVLLAYKALRADVVTSGNEIDSYASVHHIFDQLGLRSDGSAIRRVVDHLMREALNDASLVPGAEALVQDLHGQGIRLAVISSAIHHDFLVAALARFGLCGCFERIVTSASSGFYKSNPEIYRSTIEALGGHLPDCLHIGDSLRWDVGSAQRVGLKTVWLDRNDGVTAWSDAPLPVPDACVTSLVGASTAILDLIASPSPIND